MSLSDNAIVAFAGMFQQFADGYRYWKVKAKDFVIWAGTFVASIVFDLPLGLCKLAVRYFIIFFLRFLFWIVIEMFIYFCLSRFDVLLRHGDRRRALGDDHSLQQREAVLHVAGAGLQYFTSLGSIAHVFRRCPRRSCTAISIE